MDISILAPFFFALLLGSGGALAAEGKVVISSPPNGATVSQHDNIELNYEAIPGPDGDHLHLNVDGHRVDVIHPMQGTTRVGMLNPGKHRICLAVNTRGHVPTGVETCIDVTSK